MVTIHDFDKRDFKLRMALLRANGVPVNGTVVRKEIEKVYNDRIDEAQFSKAINHNLPTPRGDTIRHYADTILTEYEKKLEEETA